MRSSLVRRWRMPCATRSICCSALSTSVCVTRSEPVWPCSTTGRLHDWLLRLMRGSMSRAFGSRAPSRLKPGVLGWLWRLASISASTKVLPKRASTAPAASQRWPLLLRVCGSSRAPSRLMRQPRPPFMRSVRAPMSSAASSVPSCVHDRLASRTRSRGRFTTRLSKPPGALVPACRPLVPFNTSRLCLLAWPMTVSALIGRPSRR